MSHPALDLAYAATVMARLTPVGAPTEGELPGVTLLSGAYGNPLMRGVQIVLGMATWVAWERWLRPGFLVATGIEPAPAAVDVDWLCGGRGCQLYLRFSVRGGCLRASRIALAVRARTGSGAAASPVGP